MCFTPATPRINIRFIKTMSWLNNYINSCKWDVVGHAYPNFKDWVINYISFFCGSTYLSMPYYLCFINYSDVINSAMASQTTVVSIVYSTVCSGIDQRKPQNSVSLVFVKGFTTDRSIPRTKGQYRGKSWHHLDKLICVIRKGLKQLVRSCVAIVYHPWQV